MEQIGIWNTFKLKNYQLFISLLHQYHTALHITIIQSLSRMNVMIGHKRAKETSSVTLCGTKICQIFLSIQIMPRHVFALIFCICVCKIRRTTEIKRHNKLRNEENRTRNARHHKITNWMLHKKKLNLFFLLFVSSLLRLETWKKNSFVMTNPLCAHIKMQCSAWKKRKREKKIILASFHFHVWTYVTVCRADKNLHIHLNQIMSVCVCILCVGVNF